MVSAFRQIDMIDLTILFEGDTNTCDVTPIALVKCTSDFPMVGRLQIPAGDVLRVKIFGHDPCKGQVKRLRVVVNGVATVYSDKEPLEISTENVRWKRILPQRMTVVTGTNNESNDDTQRTLQSVQASFVLKHGAFVTDSIEHILSFSFLEPDNHVLEIGGKLGLNALVIASRLRKETQLLVMEHNGTNFEKLNKNLAANSCAHIHRRNALLSHKPLFLTKKNDVSDTATPGSTVLHTRGIPDLQYEHTIVFDTLVAHHCDGVNLLEFFNSTPDFLTHLHLIILQHNPASKQMLTTQKPDLQKADLDYRFGANGLCCVYAQPCGTNNTRKRAFYEVWMRV